MRFLEDLKTTNKDSQSDHDVMSRRGKNLRKTLLFVKKLYVTDMKVCDVDAIQYLHIKPEDEWKIEMLEILLDEKESHDMDEDARTWLE